MSVQCSMCNGQGWVQVTEIPTPPSTDMHGVLSEEMPCPLCPAVPYPTSGDLVQYTTPQHPEK